MAQWLSQEAREANNVKRQQPIMCVIGNPPYNSGSCNQNDWIMKKMEDYKAGLNEQKINLNDDYMKFIRLAEFHVEKNDSGIIAMITNNSFLDGATQRVMRRHLRETFDAIHVLNLHGDIRNETATAASDENIFDITQGVSISIMWVVDGINRKALAPVRYFDLEGTREAKYNSIESLFIADNGFNVIDSREPSFRFIPEHRENLSAYEAGFRAVDLFQVYSSGVQSKRDKICVAESKERLASIIDDFKNLDEDRIRTKYALPSDGRDWTMSYAQKLVTL